MSGRRNRSSGSSGKLSRRRITTKLEMIANSDASAPLNTISLGCADIPMPISANSAGMTIATTVPKMPNNMYFQMPGPRRRRLSPDWLLVKRRRIVPDGCLMLQYSLQLGQTAAHTPPLTSRQRAQMRAGADLIIQNSISRSFSRSNTRRHISWRDLG